jgi:hypothetical protein
VFPGHAGSYYILGYMLFIVNQLEDALDVIDMGRLVDPVLGHLMVSLETEKYIKRTDS